MDRIITGLHGIEETVKAASGKGRLYVSRKNSRIDNIIDIAKRKSLEVVNIPPGEMNKRFGDSNRGVVLQMFISGGEASSGNKKISSKAAETITFEEIIDSLKKENALVVILDGVTDPHNYGAILRSAEQFGADVVVTRSRRSVSDSDTIARTSAGAVNYVTSVIVNNLSRAIDYLKQEGFWVYSAEMDGQVIYKTNLTGKIAIVLGDEGKGVSRLVSEKCDGAVSIPSSGKVDSLNVSVAAGIAFYEIHRQQQS
ncbi:MAG: 23S rRNA (guanosine(2251)-2'-O)-methyltransferase RlmB [Spirochaetales bacterium]|nr:23S rRNA (guanosine(2251)-2'-O)-methyltransferase RlmB [Spirochaetales bacterium]